MIIKVHPHELELINYETTNEKESKKWDKLVDYIFYFIIAVLLGLLVSKLGLK